MDEEFLINYGGYYWQLFWHYLSHVNQQKCSEKYPHIKFPPIWLEKILVNSLRTEVHEAEWRYTLASVNIYDKLEERRVTILTQRQ